MTLRLVMQTERAGSSIALHGWLTGPEVAEFMRVVGDAPLPLRIDLTHLVGADSAGIDALQAQRARGVRLANASPYIDILLKGREEQKRTAPSRRGRRGSVTDA